MVKYPLIIDMNTQGLLILPFGITNNQAERIITFIKEIIRLSILDNDETYFSSKECAQILNMKKRHVQWLAKKGKLDARKNKFDHWEISLLSIEKLKTEIGKNLHKKSS